MSELYDQDLDIDAIICDNLMQYEMGMTSAELAEQRGDEMALQYDLEEAQWWYKWADWWHKKAYNRPLDRMAWHNEYGV